MPSLRKYNDTPEKLTDEERAYWNWRLADRCGVCGQREAVVDGYVYLSQMLKERMASVGADYWNHAQSDGRAGKPSNFIYAKMCDECAKSAPKCKCGAMPPWHVPGLVDTFYCNDCFEKREREPCDL